MSSECEDAASRGIGRVRLAHLRSAGGSGSEVWQTAASEALASLSATGALVLALDDGAIEAVAELLAAAEALFAAPAATKHAHAASSDACGATGYRELHGKELYDFRPNTADGPIPPAVVQHAAPRAYDLLSAAGRDLLAAVSWALASEAGGSAVADPALTSLCEPSPLPPHAPGASLLSLLRYHAGGSAAPHEDRGLLTLVASTGAGLEVHNTSREQEQWLPLELRAGDVAVLAGVTLAAATRSALQPATHRVVRQKAQRTSVALRMRGAPDALLPRMDVRALEALLARTSTSVNRDYGGGGRAGDATTADRDAPNNLGPRRARFVRRPDAEVIARRRREDDEMRRRREVLRD